MARITKPLRKSANRCLIGCLILYQQSVWYSWTSDTHGTAAMNVTSTNANFAIAVFTGTTLTDLQIAATNRNYNPPLRFPVSAGTDYSIRLDGNSSWAGDFDLTIALDALPFSPSPLVRNAREMVLPKGTHARVVEVSTNLVDWMPFQTNGDASAETRLPIGREPQRFFRLR